MSKYSERAGVQKYIHIMMIKNMKNKIFKNRLVSEVQFSHRYILEGRAGWYGMCATTIILGRVLHDCGMAYLPAYTVKLLMCGNLGMFLIIAAYILAIYLLAVVVNCVESNTNKIVNNYRIIKSQEYYYNICKTRYENIDSAKFKTKYEAGQESFYDGFHSGFHNMILDSRKLLLGITGLVVYCTLEARVDFRIALLQVALSSVSLWLNTLQKKWISDNQVEWQGLEVKIKHINRDVIDIKNAKDIRIYSAKSWILQKWDELTKSRVKWHRKELSYFFLVKATGRLLLAVKYLAVYLLVLRQVENGMAVDDFVFSIGLAFGINNWIEEIFHNIQYLQINSIHVRNTREVLRDCSGQGEESPSAPVFENVAPEICMEDVSFTFPEAEKPIFEHFNLTIHPGEKVAIVGNNGAGKTTLIKMICGLYRPTSGRLLINGFDTSRFTPEEMYQWCTVVFQDFHLLAATLAENISCMPEERTDYQRVHFCLDKVGLGSKVTSLPQGLNSNMTKELDPEGVVLSGGELQKLMIARCLYRDRPILILDEPTSALDAVAESKVYQEYYELTKQKTSIFISHRLSSTKFCDRIILLSNGRIVEEGTHEQLLARKGKYASMYTIQASYYQEGDRDA